MKIEVNRLIEWYRVNLGKIVSLLLLVVVIALLFIYIPFINIILSPLLSIIIIMIFWGILFTPKVKNLVLLALCAILIDVILTLLGLDDIAEPFGNILYFLLVFIGINYAKEVFKIYSKKE